MNMLAEKMDLMRWLMDIDDEQTIKSLKKLQADIIEHNYTKTLAYKGPKGVTSAAKDAEERYSKKQGVNQKELEKRLR